MFTFIAGLRPKKRLLKTEQGVCHTCKQKNLPLQREDQMLSVFFIPLFPAKRGEPFFFCPRCNKRIPEGGGAGQGRAVALPANCPECGRGLEQDFVYCPGCGSQL
jgi:zinc-ribbon family